jgi:HORMA domain
MHADEYQPPCFKAADANMVAHFTKKPFTMDVGAVNTNHHNVGLKVNNTLKASACHASSALA